MPELDAHVMADLFLVDEKSSAVCADHRISEENGVKVDIRPTQIEQPCGFVQHRNHKRTGILLLQFLTYVLELVRVGFSGILDVERKDGVARALRSSRAPDGIDKVLVVRYIYPGEGLGIGWDTSIRSEL